MHGLLTFVLIPSGQISPVKETVVSFELRRM